jgi:hypothetical protein
LQPVATAAVARHDPSKRLDATDARTQRRADAKASDAKKAVTARLLFRGDSLARKPRVGEPTRDGPKAFRRNSLTPAGHAIRVRAEHVPTSASVLVSRRSIERLHEVFA